MRNPKQIHSIETKHVIGKVLVHSQGNHGEGMVVYLDANGKRTDWDDREFDGEYSLTIKRGNGTRIEYTNAAHAVRTANGWELRTRDDHFRIRGTISETPGKRDAGYLHTALLELCAKLDESFLKAGEKTRLEDAVEKTRAKLDEAETAFNAARDAHQTAHTTFMQYNVGDE